MDEQSQIKLMRHACGVDSKDPYFRNYYMAAPESVERRMWDVMVEKGWAIPSREPDDLHHYYIYRVTENGKEEMRAEEDSR